MSAISRLLPQIAYIDIFGKVSETAIDVKGWIANQDYLIDEDLQSDHQFKLRVKRSSYLKAALANDCNRMAIAAFETVCGIQADPFLNRSGAWGVIRGYYSAFFAAHAILRMFGISCSQLEFSHVNKIYEMAQILERQGEVKKIENGFYKININKNFSEVTFTKYKDSHKDTWECFLNLLDFIINNVESATGLTSQKIEVIDLLSSIKTGITRSGCSRKGNWLSQVRNSVNYQHTLGVWFPYERKTVVPKMLPQVSKYWKVDPKALDARIQGSDLEVFFELTTLLLSVFRELFLACSEKAERQNHIFSNGVLRLLNSIKVT